MDAQKTPLHAIHLDHGARLVPFSGWDMPVQYGSIRDEHLAVRTRAGLFDVCHMGEFLFKGRVAAELLQRLSTNDLSGLAVGRCHYSFFLHESGGTVDDTMIYRIGSDEYLAIVNAGNIDKDWAHVESVAKSFPGADITDQSAKFGLLALQGPLALELMKSLVSTDLVALPFHFIVKDNIGGIDVRIATSGYTGENGLEIFVSADKVVNLWEILINLEGVSPCGLGSRDTLRLEASLALYGHELDDETSPIEARLGFAVSHSGKYIGSDVIMKQRASGTRKTLVAIEMTDRAIPRQGYTVESSDAQKIGVVTSGSLAPFLNKNIGMAYIKPKYAKMGSTVGIRVRDKVVAAKLVKRPFYKRPTRYLPSACYFLAAAASLI
jgi:aminomethyltransferase